MSVDPAVTASLLQRRERAAARAAEERAFRLRALAPAAAAMLRERFGASEVVLFGSLAHGYPHAETDVDLAVRGLAPSRYWSALAALAEHFDADVDIVVLETAHERMRRRVERTGIKL